MKAAQLIKYGGPDNITVTDAAIDPEFSEKQLLVEVRAASINQFDAKLITGKYRNTIPLELPFTPGGDFSGVVRETGSGVTGFKPGDEVYGTANMANGGTGSFARYAAANAVNTAKKPIRADFLEAAAMPLAGASAIQAIEDHIRLQKGQKILIQGGAGGIGHIAVQLAASKGAFVASTASGDDVEFVRTLGAKEVIDYKRQPFQDVLSNYDAVLDTVGGKVTEDSGIVLREGGILVSMTGDPGQVLAEKYRIIVVGQKTVANTARLDRFAKYVDDGVVKVHIERSFSLDTIGEAFGLQDTHPKGKVVIVP